MSERKRIKKESPDLEILFQTVFTQLPIGAFVVQNRKFRLFNPQFEKLLGYSADQLLGMDCLEPVFPNDRIVVRDNAVNWLKGKHSVPYEYRYVDKDGEICWVMETIVPGQYRGERATLGYFVDISNRKNMEIALRESEMRYRDLFNCANDAIFVRDLKSNIIEVNQAASTLTGYAVDELVEMNISGFLTPESFETAMENQQRLLKGEAASRRYDLELVKKDGTRRFIESVPRLIIEKGQPVGVQAIVRDITEQRRTSRNMQFYIAEITKAQEEERKRIARELHDETAQSLATLSLDIEAITRAKDQLSEEAVRRLEQLRAKIYSITEGVRRFSHELRPGDLDQVGLVPALELLTQQLSREGKITARVELIGSQRRLSAETELVLFRIAQEALHNVRRHSQATEAVVRVEFAQRKVKLNVIDNGCGFELPEVLGDFAGKGKLGLIGMQERARLLNSSFTVRSQAGRGTTVAVEVAR